MNSRTLQIIKLLIQKRRLDLLQLSGYFDLSPRTIRYEIEKANAFLKSINLPGIRIEKGEALINLTSEQTMTMNDAIGKLDLTIYVPRYEERKSIILLVLFASRNYYTSSFFADLLCVSKSSIDNDLSEIREDIRDSGFEIVSKRSKGMKLIGEEKRIRMTCMNMLINSFAHSDGTQSEHVLDGIVQSYYGECYGQVLDAVNLIEQTKNYRQFTYESKLIIVTYIVVMIKRIQSNHYLPVVNDAKQKFINNSSYAFYVQIVYKISNMFGIEIPPQEQNELLNYLRDAQYIENEMETQPYWTEMIVLIEQLISGMSREMNIDFTSDSELYYGLMAHLGPTSYKIMHNVHILNPELHEIKSKFNDCFTSIQNVLKTIDSPLLKDISEDEIGYLVVHFGASIERRNRVLPPARIVIICHNGIGTAKLLSESIMTRFHNIIIVSILNFKEIGLLDKMKFDFIVSSISLGAISYPYIQVSAILTDGDCLRIKQMLLKHSKEISVMPRSDALLEKVERIGNQFVSEGKRKEFEKNILEAFGDSSEATQSPKERPDLLTLLPVSHILCNVVASDWIECINEVCSVLIDSHDIDESYVRSVIQSIKDEGPYMVIEKGVALLHGSVGVGVNHLSMSLAILPDGVRFNHPEFDPVHVAVVLAPVDNYAHIPALEGLLKMLERNEIESMARITDAKEMQQLIGRSIR